MNDSYDLNTSDSFTTFDFISEGPKGSIKKIVRYRRIESLLLYNLSFGDEDPKTGFVDDSVTTNKGDSKKVLASVASTLIIFLENHPMATVFATGSSKTRTRLYQIEITNNFELINLNYTIFGMIEGEWQSFEKGKNYDTFLVRRN